MRTVQLTCFFYFLFVFFGLLLTHVNSDVEQAFGNMPILHEGRVKPMQVFAQQVHAFITGDEHTAEQEQTSISWLMKQVFMPETSSDQASYRISNVQATWLGVGQGRDYTFLELMQFVNEQSEEIASLLDKPGEALTVNERERLTLYFRLHQHQQLLNTLSLLSPMHTGLHYLDYQQQFQRETEALKTLVSEKGVELKDFSQADKSRALALFQHAKLREIGQKNSLFRIMPSYWSPELWLSPWALIVQAQGSPANAVLMKHWEHMYQSFREGKIDDFVETAKIAASEACAIGASCATWKLALETYYQRLFDVQWVSALYLVAVILLAMNLSFSRSFAFGVTCLHLSLLLVRMVLLQRPPVTNLHESVLFISGILPLFVFSMSEKKERPWPMILVYGLSGVLFFLSQYLVSHQDELVLPVAVLNTRFWLGTHVVCITLGYALCLMTSILGHLALYFPGTVYSQRAYLCSLFALSFTTLGTLLGGIWADHSWGRFWGWDPKENGALLIILWLVWALHGRLARRLTPVLFHATLAALSLWIAFSWFGVNLLSVGLHSYGFIQGSLSMLIVFAVCECLAIFYLVKRARDYA